jgi:hypothetical protein
VLDTGFQLYCKDDFVKLFNCSDVCQRDKYFIGEINYHITTNSRFIDRLFRNLETKTHSVEINRFITLVCFKKISDEESVLWRIVQHYS